MLDMFSIGVRPVVRPMSRGTNCDREIERTAVVGFQQLAAQGQLESKQSISPSECRPHCLKAPHRPDRVMHKQTWFGLSSPVVASPKSATDAGGTAVFASGSASAAN